MFFLTVGGEGVKRKRAEGRDTSANRSVGLWWWGGRLKDNAAASRV